MQPTNIPLYDNFIQLSPTISSTNNSPSTISNKSPITTINLISSPTGNHSQENTKTSEDYERVTQMNTGEPLIIGTANKQDYFLTIKRESSLAPISKFIIKSEDINLENIADNNNNKDNNKDNNSESIFSWSENFNRTRKSILVNRVSNNGKPQNIFQMLSC